ncbi:hypothetical protein [Agaribacter flavus]|uniref:VanZ-like domain-containing protein n=1 Tax=Agaribacter flavus TaxID=1902781 RepID=A0ABV7FNJ4_9ALTE
MIRYLVAITLVFSAVYLDGMIDSVRSLGITNFIVDGAPNLIASVLIPLAYIVANRASIKSLAMALYLSLSVSFYELIQIYSDVGVFDYADIVMSLTGTLLIFIFRQYWFTRKQKSKDKKKEIS